MDILFGEDMALYPSLFVDGDRLLKRPGHLRGRTIELAHSDASRPVGDKGLASRPA
jgi:hypothetical protein